MSFLERLKAQREAAASGNAVAVEEKKAESGKKASPLANILRKRAEAAKKETDTPAVKEDEKVATTDTKATKEKEKDVVATTAEALTDKTSEKKEEKKESVQDKADAVVAKVLGNNSDTETKPEEPAAETKEEAATTPAEIDKAEEPVEAKTEEKKDESAETKSEESENKTATEEAPKKRTRRTSKKKTEVNETEASGGTPTGVSVNEHVSNYDIVGQKVSYDEMVGIVMDYYIDDEWRELQDQLSKELNDIRIESDMNPGTLKAVIADLAALNDKVFRLYTEQKQLLDMLTDKDFGVAMAIQARNSVGSNAEERKRNGLLSLTKAQYDGKEVNLINLIAATKVRYAFISKLSSVIKQKSDACITMSAAIKTEEKLCAA